MTREVESLPVHAIYVAEGRRVVDQAAVSRLMESMKAVGLMQPITCRGTEDSITLVAGHHRLEAARRLDWDYIDCLVVDDTSDVDAEIAEIDENLVRREPSLAERQQQTARRAPLLEVEDPETGQTLASLGGRRKTSFAAEVAALTGRSKSSVNEDRLCGERIIPAVMEEVKTSPDLNKSKILSELARTPAEQQTAKLAAIAERRSKPTKPHATSSPKEAEDKAISSALRMISQRPEDWRVRLRDEVNKQLESAADTDSGAQLIRPQFGARSQS